MLAALAPLYAELGLSLPEVHAPFDPPALLAGQLVVVAEERVPVFSFTFGIPPPEEIRESGAGSAGRGHRAPRGGALVCRSATGGGPVSSLPAARAPRPA